MTHHGFLRVAAAVPSLKVADCLFNAERILELMARAEKEGAAVLVFPELSITGYTCADLFQQSALQKGALEALEHIARAGATLFSGLAVVGLPVAVDDQLFNCAALLHQGKVLAFAAPAPPLTHAARGEGGGRPREGHGHPNGLHRAAVRAPGRGARQWCHGVLLGIGRLQSE